MPTFVHISPASSAKSIRRIGIRPGRNKEPAVHGIYCTPVLPSFTVTHQWGRELRRSGQREYVAVYFSVPDDTPVTYGLYNKAPIHTTAAAAVGFALRAENPLGIQVIVLRPVLPKEIRRIRNFRPITGWRYFPGAHGKRPCSCPACLSRGEIKSARIRDKYPLE